MVANPLAWLNDEQMALLVVARAAHSQETARPDPMDGEQKIHHRDCGPDHQ